MSDDFVRKISEINSELFDNYEFGDTEKLNGEIAKPATIKPNDKGSYLIINLNPSNLIGENEVNDKSLLVIPKGHSLGLKKFLQKNAITFDSFFSKGLGLFSNQKVRLFWSTEEKYLDYVLSFDCGEHRKEIIKMFEEQKKINHSILVFSELFYQHDKTAKNIEKHLNQFDIKNVRKKVKEIIDLYITYYNPRIIIVTNGYASKLIFSSIQDDVFTLNTDKIKYKGIDILFSSMLTGQRALDTGSYYRLQREIDSTINANKK